MNTKTNNAKTFTKMARWDINLLSIIKIAKWIVTVALGINIILSAIFAVDAVKK